MTTIVILLALASTTCAACSTVLKHRAAVAPAHPVLEGKVPAVIAGMIGSPTFALALCFDGAAVGLQILALRDGDLSTVQPILTLALVISLGLDHVLSRTRPTRGEFAWSGALISGLVIFLVASGASHPEGGDDVGNLRVGLILTAVAGLGWLIAYLVTRRAKATIRARVQAVAVAMIYAATAALIKASTHIVDLAGFGELLRSWQLWTLLAAALGGLILNQHVFSLAPLHVSLPVIASLDPLVSVIIGRAVFDERLRGGLVPLTFEVIGLTLLVLGVVHLSRSKAPATTDGPTTAA